MIECTCHRPMEEGAITSDPLSEIGSTVETAGVPFGLITVSCVDTDVPLAKEVIGSLPVLEMEGSTYVRGYDHYMVLTTGVVTSS